MKTFAFIVFLIGSVAYNSMGWCSHDETDCTGATTIPVSSMDDVRNAFADISNATNLTRYLSPDGTHYLICFSWSRSPTHTSPPLIINNNTGKPVVVSGLHVSSDLVPRTVLEIHGSSPVVLRDSGVSFCRNCIKVFGEGHQIGEGVHINCRGTGIILCGRNHRVVHVEIGYRSCDTGIQIGSNDCSGNNMIVGADSPDQVSEDSIVMYEIAHNYKIVSGTQNYIGKTDINTLYDEANPWNNGGIEIENLANGGLQPPVVLSVSGASIQDFPLSSLTYPSDIHSLPESGEGAPAELKIKSPYAEGSIEIYTAEPWDTIIDRYLRKSYYITPSLITSSATADGQYILTYQIPITSNLSCKHAVVSYRHSYGSSEFSKVIFLNPPLTSYDAVNDYFCSGPPPAPVLEINHCEGATRIPVDSYEDITAALGDISAGRNLENYLSADGTKYLLCFDMPENFVPDRWDRPIRSFFLTNNTGKTVVVSGLHLEGVESSMQPLLHLIGNNQVVFEKSTLRTCRNCLLVSGNDFEVGKEVGIGCNIPTYGANSIGVKLCGNHNWIHSSTIGGCDLGVMVGNPSCPANDNVIGSQSVDGTVADQVVFKATTGVYVFNGLRNYFRHNKYFFSVGSEDTQKIRLMPNANSNIQEPAILTLTGERSLFRAGGGVLGRAALLYDSGVNDLPGDGTTVFAYLKVKSPYREGGLEIMTEGVNIPDPYFNLWITYQSFHHDADLVSSQQQEDGQYLLTYKFPMALHLYCKTAVAIFHNDLGSSRFTDYFKLNYPIDPNANVVGGWSSDYACGVLNGVVSAAELDAPGESRGPAGPSANLPASQHTEDDSTNDEDKEKMTAGVEKGTVAQSLQSSDGVQAVTFGLGSQCQLDTNRPISLSFLLYFINPVLLLMVRLRACERLTDRH